jgi:hypothetical protein
VRVSSTLDFPPITSSEVHVQLSKQLSTLKSHTTSSRNVEFEAAFVDKFAAKNGLKTLLHAAEKGFSTLAAILNFNSTQSQEL